MTSLVTPPYIDVLKFKKTMQQLGYAVLEPNVFLSAVGCMASDLQPLLGSWCELPLDNYLKDGGRYRYRRHSCFISDGVHLSQVQHRVHWQPIEYNALHGGMERWFEPMSKIVAESRFLHRTINFLTRLCAQIKPSAEWYIEAHQFRIDTNDGIGRPTPEGAHRDGVDFVAVLFIGRQQIKGGETRVFQAQGAQGLRFTLTEPWTLLFLDDEKVIHESTPIQPLSGKGCRDTLVLTFRTDGFQGGV